MNLVVKLGWFFAAMVLSWNCFCTIHVFCNYDFSLGSLLLCPSWPRVRVQVIGPHGRPLLRVTAEEEARRLTQREQDIEWLRKQRAEPQRSGRSGGKPSASPRAPEPPVSSRDVPQRQTAVLTILGNVQCYVTTDREEDDE
jgi:hypothetical protein